MPPNIIDITQLKQVKFALFCETQHRGLNTACQLEINNVRIIIEQVIQLLKPCIFGLLQITE